MTGLVLTSSEATGSWSPSPLIVSRDSYSLWTWAHVHTACSTVYFNGCPYIFLINYYIYYRVYVCVPYFYDLSALVSCWCSVSIRRIIYNFFLNACPFDYTSVAESGKIERSSIYHFRTVNYTFWPTIVVLHTWLCCRWPEGDSYWFFGQKVIGQCQSRKVWICCRGDIRHFMTDPVKEVL